MLRAWQDHASMWYIWRATTRRRCFAGWKEEWRGSRILDGIGLSHVRKNARMRGERMVRGWGLYAKRAAGRRRRLEGVEGRISRRSGVRLLMMVFGGWRDVMLRSVYVRQRVPGPKGAVLVVRRVIARGSPVWRTPPQLVIAAWEAYTKTRAARNRMVVTYGWTDVHISLGFSKWWCWMRRRRVMRVRGGEVRERAERVKCKGAVWGWRRVVRGRRMGSGLSERRRRSWALLHLAVWSRRGRARSKGRGAEGTRRRRALMMVCVRGWMEVSRVRRRQRWLVTGILEGVVRGMAEAAFGGWRGAALSAVRSRMGFCRQALWGWQGAMVDVRREAQGERRARQREGRMGLSKFVAPAFTLWRAQTEQGWRMRRGVEKVNDLTSFPLASSPSSIHRTHTCVCTCASRGIIQ